MHRWGKQKDAPRHSEDGEWKHVCKQWRNWRPPATHYCTDAFPYKWCSLDHQKTHSEFSSSSVDKSQLPTNKKKKNNMKFFGVLVFAAVLAIAAGSTASGTSPPSPYPTPTTPSSPSTTTYTYTTSPSTPTYTSTSETTTTKPFKQQLLSLLFNKKSG